jgi:hypothetical protein
MTKTNIKLTLDCLAAVSFALGGASTIPGSGIPPQALAWGLIIGAMAKAASSQLSQVKGESDEKQGITPAQVATSQAIHDAAAVPVTVVQPIVTPTPTK